MCEAGFSGPTCSMDICQAIDCDAHGVCSARYFGGDVEPTQAQCVCDLGWLGEKCDKNPCVSVTPEQCVGSEKSLCKNGDEENWSCECFDGFQDLIAAIHVQVSVKELSPTTVMQMGARLSIATPAEAVCTRMREAIEVAGA